jgi:hypothetical protein
MTSATSPPPSLLVFIFSFCFSTFIHSSLFLYFLSFFILMTVQFGLGGYCGGPTFLFFSHVKPNTAVTCCSVIHSPRTSLRTKRLRCCCTPPPPPPPPARLIQHH